MCRSTTQSLQASADGNAKLRPEGPHIEYHMVEAKGCGDRHCRIVAECRKKFPMPEHEQWECFGPVATADQIKYTREEDTVSESMMFREECDFCSLMGQTRNVIGAAPIRWLILVMAPVIFCRPLMISHSGRPLRSKHSRSRYSLCDGGCRESHLY